MGLLSMGVKVKGQGNGWVEYKVTKPTIFRIKILEKGAGQVQLLTEAGQEVIITRMTEDGLPAKPKKDKS